MGFDSNYDRESGWGWLRRDPKASEKKAAAKDARRAVRAARQLAWTGRVDQAVSVEPRRAFDPQRKTALGRGPGHAVGHVQGRSGRSSLL